MTKPLSKSQQALIDFAEEHGKVFDGEEGFTTITVDAGMLHAYILGVAVNHYHHAPAVEALRYWRDECTGAEPSISVFERMVEQVLGPAKAVYHLRSHGDVTEEQLLRLTQTHGQCGGCDWSGPLSECSMVGSIGPCCPRCREKVAPT